MKKIRVAGWMTGMGAAAAVLALSAQTAWAGSWIEEPMGWFYEKDDGETVRGWNQINGIWYYMDTETGVWQKEPAINRSNAPYLMENMMAEAGLHQDEEKEMEYRVQYETKDTIEVLAGWEEKPGVFHSVNTFEINKKTKTAISSVTKEEYGVY